jgi:hypothetical protein
MRGQRAALFAEPPARTYLPVSLQHTLWLSEKLLRGTRPEGLGRWGAVHVTLFYVGDWARRLVVRIPHQLRKRAGKVRRRLRKLRARRRHPFLTSRVARRLLTTVPGRRLARALVGSRSSKR